MLFKPELCQAIKEGRKTQTRRVCRPGERLIFDDDNYEHIVITETQRIPLPHQMTPRRRLKWQVGRDYAVCPGRGKKQVGRIRITSIRREPLQAISEADAIAEGVLPVYNGEFNQYRTGFQVVWSSINKRAPYRWEDNPDVWVISFEVMK